MSRKPINRAGEIFGRLTVLSDSGNRASSGDVLWLCECECGGNTKVSYGNLKTGRTASCGCLARDLSSERAKRIFTKPERKCSVDGCDQNTKKGAEGLCGKHYARMRRYGDVGYLTPEDLRAKNSRESQLKIRPAKKSTYKKLYGVHEHRVVAEKILGRKIKPDEHVHHIDFDKHNNNPSNLAVMNKNDHLKLHSDLRDKGTTDVKFKRLSEEINR